jgi:hypothetical protein
MPVTCGDVSAHGRTKPTDRPEFPLVWLGYKPESMERGCLRMQRRQWRLQNAGTGAMAVGRRRRSHGLSGCRTPELFRPVSTPINPASLPGTSRLHRRFTGSAFPAHARTRCRATRARCGYSASERACAFPRGRRPRLTSLQQPHDARKARRLPCPIQLGAEVFGRA